MSPILSGHQEIQNFHTFNTQKCNAYKEYHLLFIKSGAHRSAAAYGVILLGLKSLSFRRCMLYMNSYSSTDDSYISDGGCVNARVRLPRIFSEVAA